MYLMLMNASSPANPCNSKIRKQKTVQVATLSVHILGHSMIESFYFFIHPLNGFYKFDCQSEICDFGDSCGLHGLPGFPRFHGSTRPGSTSCVAHSPSNVPNSCSFRCTTQRSARFGDSKEPRQPSPPGKRAYSVSFISCSECGTLSFLHLRVNCLFKF